MSKWYAFIWERGRYRESGLYIVTAHSSVEEALLKIFEREGFSPNEHNQTFEGIKKSAENHPVISMSADGDEFPYWILVKESELIPMIRGLSSRRLKVALIK